MMENLQNFIKNYFSLLNVRNMPEAVLKRYKKYIADDDFPNKNVKSWSTKLMDPATNTWKNLPDFSTLSDDELNLLYLNFLRTFSAMSSHASNMDDDTKNFINTYYGAGKLFDTPPIPNNIKQEIDTLIDHVLNDSTVASLASLDWGDDETLDAVRSGRKKHESDDVRRLVFKIVTNLQRALQDQQYQQFLAPILSTLNLNAIQQAIKPFGLDDITPQNRNDLKSNAGKIFETLFKKSKTRDAFKQYEPGEKFISGQIEAALSDTDYTGKINPDNYIAPKYEDNLNLRQKIDKKLDETYNDVLKKYLTLHRANLFIKPEAKAIFGALDELKIKPTDGIDKILKESENIKKPLKGEQPFSAVDHFKWMIDKLTAYQKNGMDKAIKGALRNGHQMRHIIEQLIIDAVKEGKTKEAKTAMEVLSVMQYGLFMGRRLDAVNAATKGMKLTNDPTYSWMKKGSATEMVANATNEMLGFGIRAATLGVAGVVNSIRRTNRRFNHSGKLNDKSEDRKAELITARANFDTEKRNKDVADDALILNETTRRNGTGITDLDATKQQLERDRITENSRKLVYESCEQQFAALEKIDNDYTERENLKNQAAPLMRDAITLRNDLQSMPNPLTDQYDILVAETKRQRLNKLLQDIQQIQDKINNIESQYTNLDTEHNDIHTINPPATQSRYDIARTKRDNAQTAYENQRNDNNNLSDKINIYEEATENINTAQQQKTERQEAADKWNENNKNEYLELMGYWDFLQSGNTKSLFHISTKKLQKKMDNGKMNTIYTNWMQQHNYAA